MNASEASVDSKVKLVSVTVPSIEGIATAEELMVYCARVSSPENQLKTETGARLLKYCLEHGHVSIFEMADMTVEIETSRAIAAQLLRHRSFCFQEFSQRYSKVDSYQPTQARRQDVKNRQNSIDDLPERTRDWFLKAQADVWERAKLAYDEALAQGVAKECARMLLPLNTTTRLYMKGSVRSWIHYLKVRTDPSTQKEHREIAEGIREVFCQQFPTLAGLL